MARHSTPSSKLLRLGTVVLIAAIIGIAPSTASATVVTSAGNIPYSGISPGGVDMATGELILVMRPDLAVDGPMPLVYRRYYASMLAREGLASGRLGPNWLGTYDWFFSVASPMVNVVTNRGQLIQFQQNPLGGYDLVHPTDEKYRLAFVGGMWRLTDPLRRRVYLFDGTSHLLTQILDTHGNSLTLSYSGNLLSQVTDGLGRMLTFSYDPSGRVIQVGDGTRVVSYGYTGDVLTTVSDAESYTTSYLYSEAIPVPGLLQSVTEPAGNVPQTNLFDDSGRVMAHTDALGNPSTYTYGTTSGSVYTDALGNPWTYLHDSQNGLSMLTNPAGDPTSFAYDPLGRPSMVTRPLGDMTSFAYDPTSGYPSMVTFADGSAINWGYGSHLVAGATLFDLSMAGYPDGTSESYGRDAAGNLTDFMDRGGFHWTGTYNARGQVLTATNPSSGVTTFTYDPQGRPATEMDNAGNTSNFTYDALSRLTQVTWPDATHRGYAYDNLDGLTGLTDERGKVWSYAYDENERLMTATNPLSEGTGYLYDALDRVTQVVDPLGHATGYGYDPAGRLMSMTDRSGRTTGYQYDTVGRLTGVSDPAGGTTNYSYDADSRVISAQDPLGHASSFGYDMLDRMIHRTDPVGTGFDYTYDAMGRLLTAEAPLGHMERFGYDPRGLLTSFFNATSETDYPRTPLGEVSQLTDPNRNVWPAAYDPQGRPTSDADPLGRTTSFTYDARSRVTHAELPLGSASFTYDPASRLIDCQWLDGTTLNYSYDDANRLTGATGASFAYDAAGRMTYSNGFAMTYDDEGRILSETLAPGKVVTYSYESRGLLSQVQDWMGGTTSFTYDAARRLTGITRPNGTSAAYGYDAADRLIQLVEHHAGAIAVGAALVAFAAQQDLAEYAITRNELGWATSIDRRQPLMPGATSPAVSTFDYDAASQINGIAHDALGRTTGDGSRTFQWDGASRLTHYVAGADSPRFAYDAFGQMLTRTQGNQTVQQAWNYGHNPPTNDDTQVILPTPKTSYNVRAPSGLLLYGVDGTTGARSFYHYDEAGNTIFLTNDGGSVTTEYAYTPYGGVSALGQTADNPFTWGAASGMMQLGSSGLFRMGGGIYDAMTMRVISGNATQSGYQLGGNSRAILRSFAHLHRITKMHGPVQVGDPNISPGSWVTKNPGPAQDAEAGATDIVRRFKRVSDILQRAMNRYDQIVEDIGSPSNDPFGVPAAKLDGSGGAEIGGNDFGGSSLQSSSVRVTLHQTFAGTLMHEFGHTIGLNHGGSFDTQIKYTHKYAIYGHSVPASNFEPNHMSVMDYDYQPILGPASPCAWCPPQLVFFIFQPGFFANAFDPLALPGPPESSFPVPNPMPYVGRGLVSTRISGTATYQPANGGWWDQPNPAIEFCPWCPR